MKNRPITLLGALALLLHTANAQDNFITGRMSVSSQSSPDSESSNVTGTFGPAVGIQLNEHLVLGLGITYSGNTLSMDQELFGTQEELQRRTTELTIAPFARYMKQVNEDLSIYGQGSVGFSSGSTTNEVLVVNGNGNVVVDETKDRHTAIVASIGPGLMYKLAPRWGISADWGALHFETRTSDPESGDPFTNNTFGLSLTPSSLAFGLNWFF